MPCPNPATPIPEKFQPYPSSSALMFAMMSLKETGLGMVDTFMPNA